MKRNERSIVNWNEGAQEEEIEKKEGGKTES